MVVITVVIALFAITAMVALGVTRRLGRPWLATAGALTYPLYLLHAHIGFILINRVGASLDKYVLLAALLATMAAAAYAVHRLVERPAAPLIKRILG